MCSNKKLVEYYFKKNEDQTLFIPFFLKNLYKFTDFQKIDVVTIDTSVQLLVLARINKIKSN